MAVVRRAGEEGKTGSRIWVDVLLTSSKRRPLGGGRLFVLITEWILRHYFLFNLLPSKNLLDSHRLLPLPILLRPGL